MRGLKRVFWAAALLLTLAAFARLCSAHVPGTSPIDPLWAAAAAAGAVVFYLLDAARNQALLSSLGLNLSAASGLRLVSVSYFVSSLTPFFELHRPAMLYWLSKDGVPRGTAEVVTGAKTVYTTMWICLIALTAAACSPGAWSAAQRAEPKAALWRRATAFALDYSAGPMAALGPDAFSAGLLTRLLCWYAAVPAGAFFVARAAREAGWTRILAELDA